VISRMDLHFACETSEVILAHGSWKNVVKLRGR
jgi:hypothetical protein